MNERGLQARFIQRSGRSSTRPTRPITEMQSDTCMHDANLMLLQQCIQTAKGSAATPRQGVALPGLDSKSLTELLGSISVTIRVKLEYHGAYTLVPAEQNVYCAASGSRAVGKRGFNFRQRQMRIKSCLQRTSRKLRAGRCCSRTRQLRAPLGTDIRPWQVRSHGRRSVWRRSHVQASL